MAEANPSPLPRTPVSHDIERNYLNPEEVSLIHSVTGIQPDTRYHIPLHETDELVRRVKDGDQVAMERLIARRLGWIYKRFAQAEEVVDRFDVVLSDIMQIGMLATILAAHQTDLSSNSSASQQIHKRTPRIMIEQLIRGKLLPGVKDNAVMIAYHGTTDKLGRIEDEVDVMPTEAVLAIEELDRTRTRASTQNDFIAKDRSGREGLPDELDAKVRKTTNLRHYRVLQLRGITYQLPEPYTLDDIGKVLGVTRSRVGQMESTALQNIKTNIFRTGAPEIIEEEADYYPRDPKAVAHPRYKREDLVLISRRDWAVSKANEANYQRDKLLSKVKATPRPYTVEDHSEITHRERYYDLVFDEAAIAVDQAFPPRS